jgi:hypothetical protein
MPATLRGSELGRAPFAMGALARALTIALGVWLFISGALWVQPQSARIDNYLVGASIALIALLGTWFENARFANTILAVWLAFSTSGVFHLDGAPLWSDYLVAVGVFGLSLVPYETRPVETKPSS